MTAHPSILLIEDSPGECELFRAALKETRVAVSLQTESTAEEAFRFLAKADGARDGPTAAVERGPSRARAPGALDHRGLNLGSHEHGNQSDLPSSFLDWHSAISRATAS